jgi:hypothetical protein
MAEYAPDGLIETSLQPHSVVWEYARADYMRTVTEKNAEIAALQLQLGHARQVMQLMTEQAVRHAVSDASAISTERDRLRTQVTALQDDLSTLRAASTTSTDSATASSRWSALAQAPVNGATAPRASSLAPRYPAAVPVSLEPDFMSTHFEAGGDAATLQRLVQELRSQIMNAELRAATAESLLSPHGTRTLFTRENQEYWGSDGLESIPYVMMTADGDSERESISPTGGDQAAAGLLGPLNAENARLLEANAALLQRVNALEGHAGILSGMDETAIDDLDATVRNTLTRITEARERLSRCVICLDRPREVMFLPCAHCCVCKTCAEYPLAACPLDREPIHQFVRMKR